MNATSGEGPIMRSIPKLRVQCIHCGHDAELDGARIEHRLGEALTMSAVSRLYERLRCDECKKRAFRLFDDGGRLLIDSTTITPCNICQRPILLRRLQALPGTNICVDCATQGAEPPIDPPYPQPPPDLRNCPQCGHPTIVRENSEDQSRFLGCTRFPRGRWTSCLPN
jgi:hypothetical protein